MHPFKDQTQHLYVCKVDEKDESFTFSLKSGQLSLFEDTNWVDSENFFG